MKKIYRIGIYFFLFIVICQKAFSQYTFQVKATNTYFKQIQYTAQKDILLSSGNALNEVVISRINTNGKVKWSKRYVYDKFLNNSFMIATKDNGFMFSDLYNDANNLVAFSATKCDEQGNILWSKTFTTNTIYKSSTYSAPLLCETPNGNIYVAINNGHEFFQITKLDRNGNILWCNRYADATGLFNSTTDITSGSDDGLLVSRAVGNCEGYCTTGKLQKLDKDGNPVFARLFDGAIWSAYPVHAYYNSETIYVIGYVSEDYLSPDYKKRYYYWTYNTVTKKETAVIIPYDFFSLKEFFQKNNIVSAQNKTISNYYEGKWMINSNWSLINIRQQNSTTLLVKYDSLNRLCPDYTPAPYIDNILSADFPRPDSSYTRYSKSISASNLVINVSHFDLPLSIICSGAAPQNFSKANNTISTTLNNISLYPNPSSNLITIKGIKDKTVITVADINNRILKQYTTASSLFQIDISAFAAGAYIIRLNDGEKIVSKTFIKN